MQTLEELLEMELENPPEYPDERIASTLYCCSLSRSMRSMDAMVSSSDIYETCLAKNNWLFADNEDEAANTSVISMDMVAQKIASGMKSVDAMFYNADSSGAYSYILEFKNIGRSQMISLLVPADEKDKDSILEKISDTRLLLRSNLQLTGGYTGDELWQHTIVILVYNRRDMPSKMKNPFVMCPAPRHERGHQSRPSRRSQESKYSSVKKLEDCETEFRKKLESLELGKIEKCKWPMRIREPKVSAEGTSYILMTADEFRKLVAEEKLFADWPWGKYKQYMVE